MFSIKFYLGILIVDCRSLPQDLGDTPLRDIVVVRKLGSSGFIRGRIGDLIIIETKLDLIIVDSRSKINEFSDVYYGNSCVDNSISFQLYYQPDKIYEREETYIRLHPVRSESKDLGFVEEIGEFVIAATYNRRCIHPIRSDHTR
jgi:hypothetical protein